jgi:hypothetical protein
VLAGEDKASLEQAGNHGNALGTLENLVGDAFVRSVEDLVQHFRSALEALYDVGSCLICPSDIGSGKKHKYSKECNVGLILHSTTTLLSASPRGIFFVSLQRAYWSSL